MPRLDLTPGTVVALAAETGRYTTFWASMLGLGPSIPQGSAIRLMIGTDIVESRNQAMEDMVGDWIFFIDDDHAFDAGIVIQLLARTVDIVQPLCFRRVSPFLPTATGLDGNHLDLGRLDDREALIEVEAAGTSGMLIRRAVVEALEPPWFELGHLPDGRRVSEDVNFCRKARAAGFKVRVDLAARLAHLATIAVAPYSDEEQWLTQLTFADGSNLLMDIAAPEDLDVTDVTGPEAVPTPK